jgi:hypothetical protein
MVAGDPGALLVIEMLPVVLPVAVGANVAVKEPLPPAAILLGTPLMLKPVPLALAAEIVSVALPVLFRVMVCAALELTATLPKLTLAGVMVNCGCDAVPVPVSAITIREPGALLVMVILPVKLPAVVGANFAVKEVFCPGFRVTGVVNPVMLNPAPDAVAAEIVTLAVPEFVSVTDTEALAPVSTLPKGMLDGLAESWP